MPDTGIKGKYSGLKPYKKGVSGNPSGRPKGAAEFGTFVRQWFAKSHAPGVTNLQMIVDKLVSDDPKILLYYAFGKPVEHHEVTATHSVDVRLVAAARELARTL